jgi:hypothetical protein
MAAKKKKRAPRKPRTDRIDWDAVPTEHLVVVEQPAPGMDAVAPEIPAPTTLFGKVRVFFKGAKTLVIGGLILGVSTVAMFDPDTLPLDLIFRLFISDEDVIAKVMAGTTVLFIALRFISPGLLMGLKYAYSKNKES